MSSQPASCTYNLQPDLLESFHVQTSLASVGVVIGQKFSSSGEGGGGSVGNWCGQGEINPISWEWGGGVEEVSDK